MTANRRSVHKLFNGIRNSSKARKMPYSYQTANQYVMNFKWGRMHDYDTQSVQLRNSSFLVVVLPLIWSLTQ